MSYGPNRDLSNCGWPVPLVKTPAITVKREAKPPPFFGTK